MQEVTCNCLAVVRFKQLSMNHIITAYIYYYYKPTLL